MADTPDFAQLAREYLDLWEDQIASMATNPTLAEQSARFFEILGQSEGTASPLATAQMTAMAQQFMTLAGLAAGGKADHGNPADVPGTGSPPRQPAGSAPSAAAPDDSAQQLAQLTSRLTALEERLDRLESRSGSAGNSPKPATRKRSGGTTAKSNAAPKRSKPKKK